MSLQVVAPPDGTFRHLDHTMTAAPAVAIGIVWSAGAFSARRGSVTMPVGVRGASGPRTGLSPPGADLEFLAMEPPFGLT
jgi:hypothetical protein